MKRLRLNRLLLWLRNTRIGFLALLLVLLWAKTLFGYFFDFSLGLNDPLQYTLLILNPLGTGIILLSLGLYPKHARRGYLLGIIVYILSTLLLLANVLYYREFTDFLTVTTILGVSKVSQGLGASSLSMVKPHDIIYVLDIVLVALTYLGYGIWNIWRYIHNQPLKWPHFGLSLDTSRMPFHLPQAVTVFGVAFFALLTATSEMNRPQLLTRTFDRNYIVKYLGLAPFTIYDAAKTAQNNQVRAQADSANLDPVLQYTRSHYAAPNASYYGAAKGKNVIIIHLESFQQFLIGQKIDGQEVTPFLNSLIKEKDTLSFNNFFHQVGLGKTSDAENMLETSTFGIANGSLFSSLGTENTFEGAPAILKQRAGYTSAVFHGGSASFWNRDNVYKSLGYDNYFSGNFYNHDEKAATEYGIKDKLMLAETPKYLEHLQQPFYTKIITTSNHNPFYITQADSDFPDAGTDDATINGYFKTAHYLDEALREFFDYLKTSGLEKNSLVMLYGDHFGISNDRNTTLAPLLGKDPSKWTAFDNAQLQRVPLIFHMPGLKGGINNTYGGEIDVLPTLLHLLGISSKRYVQFGTDLLSSQHDDVVAFRNHNFVTPKYTVLGSKVYDNTTGKLVTMTPTLQAVITKDQKSVDTRLSLSDDVANRNLLRFYVPLGFKPVNPGQYDYNQSLSKVLSIEHSLGSKSTSLYSKNNDQSTTNLYQTDAPELADDTQPITDFPEKVQAQTDSSASESESSSSETVDIRTKQIK
ncbi:MULTISPECIES: LTA synthase family protein [Lacticaseibacillus]|uniref:LTA synthase family protein n=1 Tax=Lacticaseibacillus zeae subsp. silagei TaxID=3068307 RepID=A0ABD7ZC46_LACZE|nr:MULTISPECIES: LTA synthase family protein [Lacticaseibacillus]OFR94807.1 alkaline phosphatase [Lactobacillus sp. HMSC068F07]KLI76217.1 alkaline phosphatase [Lacticaseibacillus casei]MDE3316961.1 LTA synthase family protein [Lacticaseibacillus zeae]WLV84618.1 LTA synthase family protein [Lacticaseibacillus sp. NCIMB 15475]WLV87373.1 LTA synthase family protein [Lacticaseibacillus sp. NCIMB 15474]